jgi:LCP family protein required for cell wall assembly
MTQIRPRLIGLALLVLVFASCAGDGASTIPPVAPAVTTSTFPEKTTTTLPTGQVSVSTDSEVPGDLLDQVAAIYFIANYGDGAAVKAERPELDAPGKLISHLEGLNTDSEEKIQLEASISSAAIGEEFGALVQVGEDLVLAASRDSMTWRIIGTKLTSLGDSPWYGTEPRQLFIIGSDARPGENPERLRADSLHIISMVPDGSAISIVGIPRDSYVTTPEGNRRKFTNIMAGNGPDRIVGTAEILTELEFDGYILTGFKGFVALVNEFGGFTVDIPFAMNEPKSKAHFSAGEQWLNGAQALAFARNRTLSGGDFTRQFHHGVIMQWGIAALQGKGITALPESLGILAEHTFTDLDAETMILVGAALFEQDAFEIPNVVLPGSPGWAGEASVVYLAEERSQEIFADIADGIFDTYKAR